MYIYTAFTKDSTGHEVLGFEYFMGAGAFYTAVVHAPAVHRSPVPGIYRYGTGCS